MPEAGPLNCLFFFRKILLDFVQFVQSWPDTSKCSKCSSYRSCSLMQLDTARDSSYLWWESWSVILSCFLFQSDLFIVGDGFVREHLSFAAYSSSFELATKCSSIIIYSVLTSEIFQILLHTLAYSRDLEEEAGELTWQELEEPPPASIFPQHPKTFVTCNIVQCIQMYISGWIRSTM